MNVQDLKLFCHKWLDTWTGNRPNELLNFYTDDAFYLDPANVQGLKGKAQMLKYFEKLLAKNPAWVWKAEEIIPTEKGFTLKWQATIPVGANELQINGLDIVELKDSQISRNEVYFDRTPWLELMK